MKKLAVILFLLIIVVALAGCGQEKPPDENQGQEQSHTVNDNRMYTLEKYLQIKPGDSYEEVCALLGSPGEAMVDNERLKNYKWTNEDDSSLSVTFYDNLVTGKSQDSLGPLLSGSKMVKLAQFNQLKEGLTLREVTDILGPGTEIMLTTAGGQEERTYIWQNENGGTISVILKGDKVTKISEMMLD